MSIIETAWINIIIISVELLITTIGLIGIIKENKCIVITITVFSAIGVIAHFVNGAVGSGVVSLLSTVLMGVYAYMIVQKYKGNFTV